MVATGIVRRIDDLGRIVIPKEIRRKIEIEANDPLEIYYNPETKTIMLKKYESISLEEPDIHMWDENFNKLPAAKESINKFVYVRCDNKGARETFEEWYVDKTKNVLSLPNWHYVPLGHIWKYSTSDGSSYQWEDLQSKQLELQYDYDMLCGILRELK